MKRLLLTAVTGLAVGWGASSVLKQVGSAEVARKAEGPFASGGLLHRLVGSAARHLALMRGPAEAAGAVRSLDPSRTTRNMLLYFVVPVWLSAGVADWFCHRRTSIQTTTGPKESLIHLLMLMEMGAPVLAALFLEITSPVLALMIASFFAHEATALWDVSYAVTRRRVTPVEQHVHSFLEMVPLMAVAFTTVLHWPQFLALFGAGPEKPDYRIRLKQDRLPVGYLAGVMATIAALEISPYLEELWRGLKANDGRLVPLHPREE